MKGGIKTLNVEMARRMSVNWRKVSQKRSLFFTSNGKLVGTQGKNSIFATPLNQNFVVSGSTLVGLS